MIQGKKEKKFQDNKKNCYKLKVKLKKQLILLKKI